MDYSARVLGLQIKINKQNKQIKNDIKFTEQLGGTNLT
jgi:hypothetical protein